MNITKVFLCVAFCFAATSAQVISNGELKALGTYRANFEAAGKRYNLEPSLLAAVASRESRGGLLLDQNGFGDFGNAYGIMQIDKRYHKIQPGGIGSLTHINQAASIIRNNIRGIRRKFPSWTPEQQLRGGVAAYNLGVKGVWTWDNIDGGSPGNNYSADVLNRQSFLQNNGW